MSYILDALKKAERERGMTRVPTVMTVHDFRGIHRNRRAVAAGGLLMCAVALVWFFLHLQSTTVRPSSPSIATTAQNQIPDRPDAARIEGAGTVGATPSLDRAPEPAARAKTGRPGGAAVSIDAEPKSVPRSTVASNSEAIAGLQAEASRVQPTDRGKSSARNAIEPAGSSSELPKPILSGKDAPPMKEAIPAPSRTDEPNRATLREAMAKMTLNILVVEEAESQRKVYINGRKYVKGDLVDGLYLIESITPEGAVLSYQGERALLRPQ